MLCEEKNIFFVTVNTYGPNVGAPSGSPVDTKTRQKQTKGGTEDEYKLTAYHSRSGY